MPRIRRANSQAPRARRTGQRRSLPKRLDSQSDTALFRHAFRNEERGFRRFLTDWNQRLILGRLVPLLCVLYAVELDDDEATGPLAFEIRQLSSPNDKTATVRRQRCGRLRPV